MRQNIVLLLLLLLLLVGFARAVPGATISEEAQETYINETIDEEYDFL